MKVTSEGERVIDLLWEVIAARGFEKDTYFEQAVAHIRALPKLEGTVHVNLALVLKFLPMYFGAAMGADGGYDAVPVRLDAADDAYLFQQGPASGLGKIRFATPPLLRPLRAPAERGHVPEQVAAFGRLMVEPPPSEEQRGDLDFLLTLGQVFTQVVYAQLVCEAAALAIDDAPDGGRTGSVVDLAGVSEAHIDRMFAVFVQDVSDVAVSPARAGVGHPGTSSGTRWRSSPDPRSTRTPRTRSSPRCCPTPTPTRWRPDPPIRT